MYNNSFPMTYPQMTMPQALPQSMTPPTIHADIVQVGNDQEAEAFSVAVGAVQMMMAKDDSAIYIKGAYPNSQYKLDIYRKELVRPQKDVSDFVTKDELSEALKGLKTALKAKNEGVEK